MTGSSDFLAGSGEMATLMRAFDWTTTPLGRSERWPSGLRTAVRLLLNSHHPMHIFWGPEATFFYNDGFVPSAGPERHPSALGRPASESWGEIWPVIGSEVAKVRTGGGHTWYEDQHVPILREGRVEDAYWTYGFSPIDDETAHNGIGGVISILTETTKRKALESSLRAGEAQYRQNLQQMPGFAAIMSGPDHTYEYVNDAFDAITGSRQVIGRAIRDAFPEIEGQGYFELLDHVYATGEPYAAKDVPFRLAGEDADRFTDFRYQPIRAEDGAITGIFIGGYDVTDRKRAEMRQDALVQLGDVLRNGDDPDDLAYAAAELLGRTMDLSRAGYASVDHATETLNVVRDWTASGVETLAGVTHLREYGSFIDAMKRGENVVIADVRLDARTAAYAARIEDRSTRSFVNATVIEQGKLAATFFVNCAEARAWSESDLSLIQEFAERTRVAVERARSERAARRATEALHALNTTLEQQIAQRSAELDRVWRNAQDLQFVIDADGILQAVSPSAMRLLGWRPEEMVGRSLFAFTDADGHQASREALRQATREPLPPHQNRYRHKDGTSRTISWVTTPENGLIYCYGRDVTVETEQAQSLLQAEEALRQSQKLEAIGQLTGGVAHDFNNLLTVIKSSTDLLKRPNLPEERKTRYIAAISDTVDRAARLTNQLLAFARRQTLKPEVFAACDGVRAITEMVGTLTGARIKLVAELPEQQSFISADPSQFDTALINMAVNARDAMDGEGQITIAVRPADAIPAIRTHPALEGSYVAISLGDTGSGIAPDKLEQIFEPFFTTKEVGKGTGLGLSQVFGFAKQSGGDVMVESVVGEGTTFTLYLPRVAAQRRDVIEAAVPDVLTVGHDTCVLVVEDNPDVGGFSVQALIELGYLPILAASANEALAELAKDAGRFDVVFSDVVMPGMSGIDLAREIRRLHPGLPVVLTSGYSHVLAQEGTHGFELLHKPYSIRQLSQILCTVVSRQQPERSLARQPTT